MTERLESNRICETNKDPWTTAHSLEERPKKEDEEEEENIAVADSEPDIKDNDVDVDDDKVDDAALVESGSSENMEKSELENQSASGGKSWPAAAAATATRKSMKLNVSHFEQSIGDSTSTVVADYVDRYSRNIFQTNNVVDANTNKLNPNVFDSNEASGHVCEDDKSPIYERMVTNDREYSNNYLGNGNNRPSFGFSNNQNDQNGAFSFNIMDIQQPYSLSIRDSIRKLMKSRQVKSVVFRYPRFAIKSYGKEKRYLCPPPHISIYGLAWNDYLSKLHSSLHLQNNGSHSAPFNIVNQFSAQNSHIVGNHLPDVNGYSDMQMSVNNRMSNEQMPAYYQQNHVEKSQYETYDKHSSLNMEDYQNESRNKQQMLMGNFNFSQSKNNTDSSLSAIASTYDRFGDRINRIYSTISLPGVSLPDDGHIDFDEN
ncbi:MAG: hypothetical protein MHMPM18_004684, partial [Marteilia pararefringens]